MKFIVEGTQEEIMGFIGQTILKPVNQALSSGAPARPLSDRTYKKLCKKIEERQNNPDSVPPAPVIPEDQEDRKKEKDISVPVPITAAPTRKDIIPNEDDILIPAFIYDHKLDQSAGTLFFAEMQDGRVALSYFSARVFTTKEKIRTIPYPIPEGYHLGTGLSSNKRTAIRLYRKYLHSVPQPAQAYSKDPDRKELNRKSDSVRKAPDIPSLPEDIPEDPDWQYKPVLKGAFSTRTDYDGGKIGPECGL